MANNEPTLDQLTTLFARATQINADRNLAKFRETTGGSPDVSIEAHRVAMLYWLNSWLCRIGYQRDGEPDKFGDSLIAWQHEYGSSLPSAPLTALNTSDIKVIADAYDDLRAKPATPRRSIAPTAAAKILFVVRPETIPPWDRKIAFGTVGGVTKSHFAEHITQGNRWAVGIHAEAEARSISNIPTHVGRPNSSLAKIWDEWHYLTITRGL